MLYAIFSGAPGNTPIFVVVVALENLIIFFERRSERNLGEAFWYPLKGSGDPPKLTQLEVLESWRFLR